MIMERGARPDALPKPKRGKTALIVVSGGGEGALLARERYHRCMSERELRQIAIIVLLGVIGYAVVVGGAMMLWPVQ
jgi:hypothetical protein